MWGSFRVREFLFCEKIFGKSLAKKKINDFYLLIRDKEFR